jgi:Fe-S-cluster containining protein
MSDADVPAQPGRRMERETPWSYACGQCGNCCRDKDFILTPYDVARLAEGLGLSTAETMARYVDPSRPALKTTAPGGWCVFFEPGHGCTVHQSRPAVCRLYPLGRTVTREGRVVFEETEPHPETKGRYGVAGTVDSYLLSQDMAPYLEALLQIGAFLDDCFAAAGRAGVLDQLDAAVLAYWTGEGGPVPFNVLGQDLLIGKGLLETPLGQLQAHLEALRPLCGLDLSPPDLAALLETPDGRAKIGRLVVTGAVLGVGLGLSPGFSNSA